jgi:4-hydroxy-tetrahydrodipicolinate synthase
MSCSDQNFDVVLDLARHAEAIGADYIVVHAPVLHFVHDPDDLLFDYYKHISDQVEIGIALWSHPDSGYLMSPELCARDRRIAQHCRHQIQRPARDVREADATGRRQALVSHGLRGRMARQHSGARLAALSVLLAALSAADGEPTGGCATTPISPLPARRMRRARSAASLQPVREALKRTRPGGKPQAHQKYWQELLGQVGGHVRVSHAGPDRRREGCDKGGL